MRNRYLLVILGLAVVLALAIWRRSSSSDPMSRAASGGSSSPASAAGTAPSSGSGQPPAPSSDLRHGQVRRLTSDERRRLGDLIAAARQRRRDRTSSTNAGSVDDDVIPLEQVEKPLQDALGEAIHLLAECYERTPGGDAIRDAAALMTMTSDPELGTVIDTDQITDAGGKPIAPRLDECLRDTIDSLALPPLGAGGKLKLKYTFKFN